MLVPGGEAELWTGVRRFWIGARGPTAPGWMAVEASRAYRDRLVLKLAGLDDADRAARLRGALVEAGEDEAPELPAGSWFASRLVGCAVIDDRTERVVGEVTDVLPTGGVSLLVVPRPGREELLVPLAPEIAVLVAPERRVIRVRLPEGLEALDEAGPPADGSER